VILADAAYSQRRASRSGIIERVGGKLELRVGPRDLTWSTLGWQNAEAQEQAREEAEERRLWYVAATRVRDHLVIPVALSTEGKAKKMEHWAMSEELSLRIAEDARNRKESRGETGAWIYPLRPGDFLSTTSSLSLLPVFSQVKRDDAAVHDYGAWEETRRAVLASGKQTKPLSAVTTLATEMKQAEFSEKTTATARGREQLARLRFGRAVHAALRRASTRGETSSFIGNFPDLWKPEEKEEVEQLVANALTSPVMLRARTAEERFAEAPISLHLNGGLIEGVIDLAFIENGAWVVVDFKTDNLVGDVISTQTDAYRAQLCLYALALEHLTQRPVGELVLLFVRPRQEVIFPWGAHERRLAETLVAAAPGIQEGNE
jgi:ATP-dependent helicase/nuclease subunit A